MKKRFRFQSVAITLCLLGSLNQLAFSQTSGEKNLIMYRNNPQLTGETNQQPVSKLKEIKFRFKTGGPIRSTAAIMNNVLYFGSGDSCFYAVNAISGKELWKFRANGAIHSSPCVINTTVWFTGRDGYLRALNTNTGKELWKFKMGADLGQENYWDTSLSSPIIVGDHLFVGGGDGYLYNFEINTKKLIWKYNAGERIRNTPAISGENVVFGANSGILFNVNATTGRLQWKFATDGAAFTFESGNNDRKSIVCSASIQNGIVVTGGRDGIIYGIDLASGKEKWRNDHKGPWILSTAIQNEIAYIGCGSDRMVQAVDLKTGVEKWHFDVSGAIFSSITIAGDLLYFSDVNNTGNIYAIDKKTGVQKWGFSMGAASFCTPVIADGVMYCGAENGMLYALQGESASDATGVIPQKMVFWEKKKRESDFSYFQNGTDEYIKNYFVGSDYKLIDAAQLEQAMKDQLETKSRSVIVFAKNWFPDNVTNAKSGEPLVKKYLHAGGKIALLGINPVGYVTDTAGNVLTYQDSLVARLFEVKYPEKKFVRGIYHFWVTAEGRKGGLYSSWTGFSNRTIVAPDKSITALVKDEFGTTVEWLKNFGGPTGTGLLQLYMFPDNVNPPLPELRMLIEHGISW